MDNIHIYKNLKMHIIKNVYAWSKDFINEWPYSLHNSTIGQMYHSTRIWIRDLFFPNNVIKIKQLDRHWHDRDDVLFHAMFQVLCDFIEQEKPFISYDDPDYDSNKKPSIKKMRETLQKCLEDGRDLNKIKNNIGYHLKDEEDLTEEDKNHILEHSKMIIRQYRGQLDILGLYEWYTVTRPQRTEYIHNTINTYRMGPNGFQLVKNENKHEHFITLDEYYDIEKEYELIDNIMMRKLLYYRRWLWT